MHLATPSSVISACWGLNEAAGAAGGRADHLLSERIEGFRNPTFRQEGFDG
jgi:hypothetical protein